MEFDQLGRKELQALAKQYGIKANQSNAKLVEALSSALVDQFNVIRASEAHDRKSILDSHSPIGKESVLHMPEEENSSEKKEFSVGDAVEVLKDNEWTQGTLKRINKSSYRVILSSEEITVKVGEIRFPLPAVATSSRKSVNRISTIGKDVPLSADKVSSAPNSVSKVTLTKESEAEGTHDDENMIIEETDNQENFDENEEVDYAGENDEIDVFAATGNFSLSRAPHRASAVKTPSHRFSSDVTQAWNSCAKVIEPSFQVDSVEKKSKTPQDFPKKSFSATPSSKTNKPAIKPKMTNAQRLRMELLQKKNNVEKSGVSNYELKVILKEFYLYLMFLF